MALDDVTSFRTSKNPTLPGSVFGERLSTLKDYLDSVITEIVSAHWAISARERRGGADQDK
jgi:hypothetical protein